jgi:uncharacterized protein (TIGR02646 family)
VRRTTKGAEPDSLAAARRERERAARDTGARPSPEDWATLPTQVLDDLRRALHRDQQGLCAYCCGRFEPEGKKMKIEHFYARSTHPERMFDWDNLLGVCLGRSTYDGRVITHCDTHRGNNAVFTHPVQHPNPEVVLPVRVAGADLGSIEPRTDEAGRDVATLHLNAPHLVHNRAEVIHRLRQKLRADDSAVNVQRLLATAQTPVRGQLPPHANVAVRYLARKLHQRG